jgi:hypothetical protein
MPDQQDAASDMAALRRRRAEVEAWLDGPVKKATLAAIARTIAELEREAGADGAVSARVPVVKSPARGTGAEGGRVDHRA